MGAQNYMEMKMDIIYQNFDTIEISFQCAIPLRILSQLEHAQKEARSVRNKVYAEIGHKGLPVMVNERGARGGYTYQFDTGHDGQIWLIGDREDRSQWNVRVKIRSLCLALYGYEATKEKILNILDDDLSAKGSDDNFGIPKERISRVDYCLDFALSEPFEPKLENFVCHGRTKKSKMGDIFYNVNSTGQSIETITVGKNPNRQITFYNKIKEITAKRTDYWWRLWDLNKKEFKKEIWRIEIRAYKKELNKWNLKTFEDLEKIIGNVIEDILVNYKYTNPKLNDTNRNRWPKAKIWNKAIKAIKKDLFSYYSKTNEEIVLNQIKENIINQYEKLIHGIFVGYTAATGKDISEIPVVLDYVCGQIMDEISENPQKAIQKYNNKQNEFSFLKVENS